MTLHGNSSVCFTLSSFSYHTDKIMHHTHITSVMSVCRCVKLYCLQIPTDKISDLNSTCIHIAFDLTFCSHKTDPSSTLVCKGCHKEGRCYLIFKLYVNGLVIYHCIITVEYTSSVRSFFQSLQYMLRICLIGHCTYQITI